MALHLVLLLAAAASKGAAEMTCDSAASKEAQPSALPRLRRDILCEYDREMQPQVFINVTINVYVRTARVVHRTLDMRVLMTLQWQDSFLAWDPARYDGVKEVQLSSEDIWTPTISTISTLPWVRQDEENNGEAVPQQGVWPGVCHVSSNGTVNCAGAVDFGGSCVVSHLYWPRVEAICGAYIGSDFRLTKNMGIAFGNEDVQTELSDYVPDNEWVVTTVERDYFPIEEDVNAMVFRFQLYSRGVIISTALFAPAVVLSVLLLGSFCLPIKSDVRLGFCCCSLFGTILASSLLFEYLDPHDGPNPIAVTFYTGLLILSAIAVLMLCILNIVMPHSSKAPAAPRWLYSFQIWLFNSQVGKLWLRALLMDLPGQNLCQAIELMPALYMQRGEHPRPADNRGEENESTPCEVDDAPVLQIGAATSGPHRIWDFTASFLNRCMFCIFLLACCILCIYLASGMSMYKGLVFDEY